MAYILLNGCNYWSADQFFLAKLCHDCDQHTLLAAASITLEENSDPVTALTYEK